MWDDAVITNVGKTLLAQWAAGGTFNIDSAAAGTGTVNASLLMAQTGLVAQKQTMSIVKSEKITGGVRLQLQLTNKGVSAQYTINQIGVWGSLDGGATTMMAIFQDDDGVVVPAEADTPEYVFTVYAVLQMDNTGTLTVTIDSSVAVSQAQFNELEQKVENLDATDISLSVDGVTGKTVAAGIEELADKVSEIEGGVVTSVNGQKGAVTITPAGIGAATEGALQDVIDGETPVAKATNADNATTADSATNATHATSADNAAYADSASSASQADYALTAKADAQGNDISATYAKKSELPTEVTIDLNGSPTTSPSFYAPTSAGTAGQVLISQGENQAPVWGEAQKKDIANATVTLGASLTFNGSAQTQTITSVTLNGETLVEGTDYKVAGNIATDAGNYTLAVMGIGDYTGTLWVDWSIAKAQGSISVPASVDVVGFAGTQKQVAIVVQSGYGDLVAISSNPEVVTAGVMGTNVMLTLVGSGSATVTVMLVGNYQASAQISVAAAYAYSVLANNTPAQIRYIADNDLGASYWAVGDTYPVPLNGTVGTKTYDNVTVWAYILGFNHNPDREGEHLIHFGGFKTAQTDGVDICLVDSHYNSSSENGEKWFNMNHWGNSVRGGWARCDMRYDILGSTNVEPDGYGTSASSGEEGHDPTSSCATSPVAGTLMAAFPSDLRAVMKPATKYTDNTGMENDNASSVTATRDYLPLLAEFEVQGERKYANSAEQNYQTQYAYYANGNSKVKYEQSSPSSAAYWCCRSPNNEGYSYTVTCFCNVNVSGIASYSYAYRSVGVSPVFFI